MAPRAIFVGAPGAGKSTVGRRVAERLKLPFLDTDQAIEERAGMSVSDIFINQGEPEFRALEETVVADAIVNSTGIVSLGGGALLSPTTRKSLQDCPVIWLQVSASDAANRVGMTGSRPLLLGNVRGTMMKLLEERTPLYAEVADLVLDTSGRTARVIVDDVISWLENAA
jgi:shikimate kinase